MLASGADWGNIPQWISGLLSGTSLLIALGIVRRDRTLRLRRQAEQLGVFINAAFLAKGDGTADARAQALLYNGSDHVIYRPEVEAIPLIQHRQRLGGIVAALPASRPPLTEALGLNPLSMMHLHPKEAFTITIELSDDFESYQYAVVFRDAQNRFWQRRVGSNAPADLYPAPIGIWERIWSVKARRFVREIEHGRRISQG